MAAMATENRVNVITTPEGTPIIKNVRVLKISNCRFSVLQEAVTAFDGTPVNLDDGSDTLGKSYQTRVGSIRNPKAVADGIIADIELNPMAAGTDQVTWDVENCPAAVGIDPKALCQRDALKGITKILPPPAGINIVVRNDERRSNAIFEDLDESIDSGKARSGSRNDGGIHTGIPTIDALPPSQRPAMLARVQKLNAEEAARKAAAARQLQNDRESIFPALRQQRLAAEKKEMEEARLQKRLEFARGLGVPSFTELHKPPAAQQARERSMASNWLD